MVQIVNETLVPLTHLNLGGIIYDGEMNDFLDSTPDCVLAYADPQSGKLRYTCVYNLTFDLSEEEFKSAIVKTGTFA